MHTDGDVGWDQPPTSDQTANRGMSRRRILGLAAGVACSAAMAPIGIAHAGGELPIPELPIPLPIPGLRGEPNLPNPLPIPGLGGEPTLPTSLPIPGLGGEPNLPIPLPIPGLGGEAEPLRIPALNLPAFGAPVKLFGEVIPPGVFRSAQPSKEGFAWLRSKGINSVVNLRAEHDDGKDALKAAGFRNYLHLPIVDLQPPSNEQAERFLGFVRERANWPVLAHCNLGIMRAGTMSVLARYAILGVPLEDAIVESIPFGGGPILTLDWLTRWADSHGPASHPLR